MWLFRLGNNNKRLNSLRRVGLAPASQPGEREHRETDNIGNIVIFTGECVTITKCQESGENGGIFPMHIIIITFISRTRAVTMGDLKTQYT